MGETASRAEALVRRARRRATTHGVVRAVLAGVAVGALLAAAVVVGAALTGRPHGAWPILAAALAVPVVLQRLPRVRPSRSAAALLLDRAAGTEERLLAAVSARDPEVRSFAARQALERPSLAAGAFPLRFPPSAEGLAAVLAIALLAGSLLLAPALGSVPAGHEPSIPFASAGSASPKPGSEPASEPGERPPGATAKVPGPPVVSRIENGEDLTDSDWRELDAAGLTREEREAIRAALAAGDREGAANSARSALRRAKAEAAVPEPADEGGWGTWGRALETPGWSPRHDRVVREYFRVSAQRGLR